MKILFYTLIIIGYGKILQAQDIGYVRKIVDTLTSTEMAGRGYVNSGCNKASAFLAKEFDSIGLKQVKNSYFQQVLIPVNTFPGKMHVTLGKEELIPGKDYLVEPYSGFSGGKIEGKFELYPLKRNWILKSKKFDRKIASEKLKNKVVLVDEDQFTTPQEKEKLQATYKKLQVFQGFTLSGLVSLTSNKLTWSVANYHTGIPFVRILKSEKTSVMDSVELQIENKYYDNYNTQNVLGIIPGVQYPDSFIVITAHYDHLGMMGDQTNFPGANDNASGTAMMLDMAKYLSKKENRLKYSVLFIAFAAEEAGLLGSAYFVKYPFIPLKSIKFLLNLDLMGNGEEGITVDNGKDMPAFSNAINQINEAKQYVKEIKFRGNRPNSDHYYFAKEGVPAVFVFTRGAFMAYHDIDDKGNAVPFSRYNEVFLLLTDYLKSIGR